jgi:hypothetical protein
MNWGREFKKLYNSPEQVIMNMRNVHGQCLPEELINGKDWYKHANLFSLALSERYKVSEMKVAGVIAALSPQKEWLHNKVLAEEFLRTNGKITRHTAMQSNKARKILNHAVSKEDIELYLGGLKTINFFNNIYDPLSRNHVTVDRHHIYLSVGWDAQSCTPKQYEFLKQNTIIFAKEIDIIPNELQSTLWVCWKRIKKDDSQEKENNSKKTQA